MFFEGFSKLICLKFGNFSGNSVQNSIKSLNWFLFAENVTKVSILGKSERDSKLLLSMMRVFKALNFENSRPDLKELFDTSRCTILSKEVLISSSVRDTRCRPSRMTLIFLFFESTTLVFLKFK